MRSTLQTRLLVLCFSMIFITVVMISGSYFILIKKDKHRESQDRIQIGFDVVADDLSNRLQNYTQGFDEYLKQAIDLRWVTDSYDHNKSILGSSDFIVTELARTAQGIKKFGSIIRADRLTLYTRDRRVLLVFQRHGKKETVGGYGVTKVAGLKKDTYISMDDFSQLSSMFFTQKQIPYKPLPQGVDPWYKGEFPDHTSANLFAQEQLVGIRISAPVYHNGSKTAVLVGEILITQAMVERYSKLSKTHLNFFAGSQLCVGTLPCQKKLKPNDLQQMDAWDNIRDKGTRIKIVSVSVNKNDFYQGRVALKSGQNIIGAITISLSQEIEKNEIENILMTIFIISLIVIPGGFISFLLLTRRSIQFVQKLILYIGRISKGDIPDKINDKYNGEFELIKNNLNRLIETTNETSRIAEKIAAGDLTGDLIKRSEHDRLMKALDSMNKDLQVRVDEKVTELRLAHERMKESETLLRLLIQTIPDLIWLKDPHGIYLSCNSKFESLFGAKEKDIIGKTDYDFVDKALANAFRYNDHLTMAKGKASINEEEVVFASNGRREILETIKTPMYSHDGPLIGILGIGRVITQRKKAEQTLRQQQKLESIGTLAGGVAHEINNPINGIMNYAQVIKDKVGSDNPITEFADEIIHETNRVATIVRNLLTFARDEKESHKPVRLIDIIENTMSLIQTVFKRDQIHLEINVSENLPKIKCRSQQIQQVIMNLVSNSRDALNDKFEEFSDNKKILISSHLFKKGGRRWTRTTVTDFGVGIENEILDNIFDPFFTTKQRGIGTGLGLSISYGIVKDHHGELSVESDPGQYTTFHMDLPMGYERDPEKDAQI